MQAHQILNLPERGYSLEQLRYNYKVLARQLHPDKRPRNMTNEVATQMFQRLTEAYRQLVQKLEADASEGALFGELRAASRRSAEATAKAAKASAPSQSRPIANKDGSTFNLARFNGAYDDNRIPDPIMDNGYADWMSRTEHGKEDDSSSAMIERKGEPQCMVLTAKRGGVSYTELGAGGVTDYSRLDSANTKRSVNYTDYKVAHSTHRLVTDERQFAEAESRRELRSIDALQKHREKAHLLPQTEAELRMAAEIEQQRHDAEQQRLANLSTYDRMIEAAHERVSRLALHA
jgi:curved DNA-binding protein CbpA